RKPFQLTRFVKRIFDSEEINEFYCLFPEFEKCAKNDWERIDGVDTKHMKEMFVDAMNERNQSVVKYLAVRWSLKEAAYKALYPHHKATWKDLSVKKVEGKPCLILSKRFQQEISFDIVKTHSSISHDGEYVIGQVLIEGENQ
ncbi:5818_t:CDS:2, partial [Acaulospora morrowiae]